MPTTTGKSPAKNNRFNCSVNYSIFYNGTYFSNKGSRFSIAAFLLLITALFASACETPGSIGGDIISEDESVESQTVYLQDFTVLEENAFSGRLANTALGYFEDPLYGTLRSVALLKPSISSADVDTILDQDTISLQLIFSEEAYGDSLATSSYEVYEAGEIWRGAELRYNNEISVDMGSKVAEFQVTSGEDSVIVELSDSWKNKFAGFFNPDTSLTSAERDSIYINNFPGLAVVPSEGNQNIRFLKTLTDEQDTETDDEEQSITRFLVQSPEPDEEEGPNVINVRDWGISSTRQAEPSYPENIVLHNTERVLRFQLNLSEEDLSSKNIVNAQLVFSKNNNVFQNSTQITRPNTNLIRAHVFDEEPDDVMGEIFTTEASLATSLSDSSNAFLMNVTQFVLNEVYGDVEDRILYVTIESINGIFYSSHFFDPNSADIRKPRLVITYVEE